ncbi:uncharacterized protein [Hoplias malabaricus]|uniref:uncharacterized protein n=1 Tax=Hoplias malabaricus TaxID=27720 RepID=UPI003462279F
MMDVRILGVALKMQLFFVFSSASAFNFTMVKLHEAAFLPCYHSCSGLVTWSMPGNKDVLAQCNRMSCQFKEGFHMSHGQYLQGNLSLTIHDADFSKKSWYTCTCGGQIICDVSLRLEPFSFPVVVQTGGPLSLDFPNSDDIEVAFKRIDNPQSSRLCTIKGDRLQCESAYEKRVMLSSTLQLKQVKSRDGGIYIIRDIKNDEVIGMYNVTVEGSSSHTNDSLSVEGIPRSQYVFVQTLAAVFGGLLVVAILVIAVLIDQNRRLQKCQQRTEKPTMNMQQLQQQQQQEPLSKELEVHSPVMETVNVEKKNNHDSKDETERSDDEGQLLMAYSSVNAFTVTEEPQLSVSDSCSHYPDQSQNTVFE